MVSVQHTAGPFATKANCGSGLTIGVNRDVKGGQVFIPLGHSAAVRNPGVLQGQEPIEEAEAIANGLLWAAAPDLVAELREARTTLAITRTQIMVELNRGVERWEGVPEALKLRLDAIDAALAKALGEGQ